MVMGCRMDSKMRIEMDGTKRLKRTPLYLTQMEMDSRTAKKIETQMGVSIDKKLTLVWLTPMVVVRQTVWKSCVIPTLSTGKTTLNRSEIWMGMDCLTGKKTKMAMVSKRAEKQAPSKPIAMGMGCPMQKKFYGLHQPTH